MRFSKLFARTLREAPADAELVSHNLLMRAGYVRPLASGIFSQLTLGTRVVKKIERIMREEMDRIEGQELILPVVHPAEIWQETGRWYAIGPEMLRFRDRAERDMVFAMTHEEVVTDIARKEIASYRQLPQMVYQIQTKFRDEPRPRGGLIRVREFTMKDAYSLHATYDDLDAYYPRMSDAYVAIFKRAGLDAVRIEADSGMMGGTGSHEFVLIAESGENTIVRCEHNDYAANLETARCATQAVVMPAPQPMIEVATPHMQTIEDVAQFVGVSPAQTLKSMLYMVDEELVMIVLRGDRMVNDFKLPRVFGTDKFRPALPEEIRASGAVEGYASPLGLSGVTVYADESVLWGGNFVAGANKEGYHVTNANVGRDLKFERFYDLSNVQEGDRCPVCNGSLGFARGIEVGHIFKLGTKYTESMHAYFLDKDGVEKPIIMGCYGIGSGRLMAAAVEQHHDDKGIIWPMPIAPFQVHLVGLGLNDAAMREAAEAMYRDLQAGGFDVLFDDREEAQAGVKFNDADLVGIPIRLTLSPRSVKAGGAEVKLRKETTARVIPLADVQKELRALVDVLMAV
ncbi:MAG: proline--tRNA ligase [Chloroflexi bacterium]|nr:proline--tRNA ligase [Chloroflexota bacterium]